MKFKCLKKDIQKIIAITESIVAGKIVYNIESNVVFQLKDNILTLMATDNSVWVKGEIELSDYSGEGVVAVYAKKIGGIIKEMPEGFLSVDIDANDKINISSENGKIRHTIIGIKPEDFPEYPEPGKDVKFITISAKEFATMAEKTLFAVSKETLKPALRGIYFEKENDALRAVATDGKRLAYIERHFEQMGGGDFDMIVDPKALIEALSVVASDKAETISFGVGAQQIYLRLGSFQFVSALIEGKYPNYRQVIPKDFSYSFRVNRADILDAIRRVVPMINDVRSKRLLLEVGDGFLRIKGVNQEMGESVEEIEAHYRGEEHTLAVNFTFLQEALTKLDSDVVAFRANNDTTPIMAKEIEREDYFYIVMPMRLDEDYA